MRRALLAALVAVLLLLSACAGESPSSFVPGPAKIDVDTPKLRALKKEAGVAPCRPGTAAPVEGGLPQVTVPCLAGGKAVDLSSLRGPMVVSFWQSTCAPCRLEMPALEAFHQQYGEQVAVLGVDWQDVQVEGALDLVKKTGVTYPLVADPQNDLGGAGSFPEFRGMPYLAFVAADGTISHQQYGGVTSEAELVKLVDEHLGTNL